MEEWGNGSEMDGRRESGFQETSLWMETKEVWKEEA